MGSGPQAGALLSYNNAAAAAQNAYPDHLIACGVLPFGSESIEACTQEAKRAVGELGIKTLMINSNRRGQNRDSFGLNPFWEVVNDLQVPLCIHGNPFTSRVNDHAPTNFTLDWERMRRLHVSNYLGFGFEYMLSMASLTLGGLLRDFTNLSFAYYEAGASWLPWVMDTLDRTYGIEPQCARCDIPPSECIREACLVMAEPDEDAIVDAVNFIGSKNFIVGSDYPHPPSTFPNTAAGIDSMKGLSQEAKDDMLGGNIKRMFKL
jgi:predicted TIM-barrel fold metal-dependent hydrolase